MDQVENFKENETFGIRKLENIEDDRDVRNLIYQRLQMDTTISDDELRREAMPSICISFYINKLRVKR